MKFAKVDNYSHLTIRNAQVLPTGEIFIFTKHIVFVRHKINVCLEMKCKLVEKYVKILMTNDMHWDQVKFSDQNTDILSSLNNVYQILSQCIRVAFNPIALRKAKIVYNFGLSECYRVKSKLVFSHEKNIY